MRARRTVASWLLLPPLILAACGKKQDESKASAPGRNAGAGAAGASSPGKVSKPTASTLSALRGRDDQVLVLSFVPPGPAADLVIGYFADLADQSGKRLTVRERDRMVDVAEAQTYKVVRADTVVLVAGDRSASVTLGREQLEEPAPKLVSLDHDVAAALAKLGKPRGAAVLLTIPPAAATAAPADPARLYTGVTQALAQLGYRVETHAVDGGPLPADARLLLFFDTGARPLDAALTLLDAHIAGGGAALIALEPVAGTSLGPLEQRLGLRYTPEPVADDKNFLRRTATDADHHNLVTNGFASHPATAIMSRAAPSAAVLFATTGSFDPIVPAAASPLFVVRSTSSAFRDLDHDDTFDEGSETRGEYALVAAVELRGPAAGAAGSRPVRTLVYADADWVTDAALTAIAPHQALLIDGLRWLGGDADLVPEQAALDPATVELTSYPRRAAPPAAAAAAPLWKASGAVTTVTLAGPARTFTISHKGACLWGRVERAGPGGADATAREFPIDEAGDKALAALAAPAPLRALGPLDPARKGALGLEEPDRLTVGFSAAAHELLIGGRVYGGSDRYALDPATNQTYVVAGSLMQPLYTAEGAMRLRRLVPLDTADVLRVTVEAGGKRSELAVDKTPNLPAAGSPGQLGLLLVERTQQLSAVDFVADGAAAPKLRTVARLTFAPKTGAAAELELLVDEAASPPAYYARTPRTCSLARLTTLGAEMLVRVIQQASGTP